MPESVAARAGCYRLGHLCVASLYPAYAACAAAGAAAGACAGANAFAYAVLGFEERKGPASGATDGAPKA